MNLLAAFMLRSVIFLWGQMILGIWHEPKYQYLDELDAALEPYMDKRFEKDSLGAMKDHQVQYCIRHMENEAKFVFLCRLYPAVQHYIVIVCFSWLACEGLYLILLQQRPAVLFERINQKKPLRWFVGVSWILPAVIVSIWAIVMLQRPDGEFSCFDNDKYIVVS